MRRLAWGGVFAAMGLSALAAGYDDYLRATQLLRADRAEQAIPLFTAALAAGDLAPSYQPSAYTGRGQAYIRSGECAPALADAEAALKLRADFNDALLLRSHANQCLGNTDAALADLNRLIVLNPVSPHLFSRGLYYWKMGRFTEAAADFARATDLAPKTNILRRGYAYNLLWAAISEARAKNFNATAFAERVKKFDSEEWPGPITEFLLGNIKADAVYPLAVAGEGKTAVERKCEADFYIAEWQIAAADPAGKALLQSTVQTCPSDMVEVYAAKIDLRRLP